MAINTENLQDLQAALLEFETCLETPIVSGEMEPWVEKASAGFANLRDLLTDQILHQHPGRYKQIAQEDLALERAIEQMKSEDNGILTDAGVVSQLLQHLEGTLKEDLRRETFESPDAGQLIEKGIAFVIRARKQLVALDTWTNEAFNRERGNVD